MTYSRFTLAFALVWFLLAALATASGLLQEAPMPFPQILIFLLTNVLLLLFWKQPQLHAWATRETIRTLVLIHVSRLVAGATFLIFHAQGKLPYAFAVPGGWGDIVVGLLALTVCWRSGHSWFGTLLDSRISSLWSLRLLASVWLSLSP
jgi:hypothetical protein